MPFDPEVEARLARLECRVHEAWERVRALDDDPHDAFRGLYITSDQVGRLLAEPRGKPLGPAAAPEPVAPGGRLSVLSGALGLTELDLDILLIAMVPDLDQRYERFYGYLHDDVTRRRASPGLTLELLGLSLVDAEARHRFSPDAPLIAGDLLVVEDEDRPFLGRALRVPDRVTSHVLGSDAIDPDLVAIVVRGDRRLPGPEGPLARVLRSASDVVYLRELGDAGAAGVGEAAFAALDQDAISIDLTRADPSSHMKLSRIAIREGRLGGRGLVVGPIDEIDDTVVRLLTEAGVKLVLHGRGPWEPERSVAPAHVHELACPTRDEQRQMWLDHLGPVGELTDSITGPFRLGPTQIRRAVSAGLAEAVAAGVDLDEASLAAGARNQNSAGLTRLARRVVPEAGWDDLVVPPGTREELEQVISRVAHRERVLDDWGLRRGGGRGEGITALFAGDSGTGKTLAAEVVARALGLDLYVIDLSTVIDKYVGETEKNLERIFVEAEGINGVLFFDEADALFGKRSEVSDARDRYANVEVAYLLQRMEQFDGLAVLASNLKGNMDEAFSRRLSVVVDFPDPDLSQRRELWGTLLCRAPLDTDADLDFLAAAFEVTGGNIRNIVVTASYLAAAGDREITMADLVRGVEVEYRKLGRLCLESEFGPYIDLLAMNGTRHHGKDLRVEGRRDGP